MNIIRTSREFDLTIEYATHYTLARLFAFEVAVLGHIERVTGRSMLVMAMRAKANVSRLSEGSDLSYLSEKYQMAKMRAATSSTVTS